MKFSVAAAALLLAFSADAHCYSIWRYPWKQQCDERIAQRQDPPTPPVRSNESVMLPPFTVSPLNTIILTPRPGRTDEEGRNDALKILREVMGK